MWHFALWGLAGAVANRAVAFAEASRRSKGRAGGGAYAVSVVIHVAVATVVTGALTSAGVVTNGFVAFGLGAVVPVAVKKVSYVSLGGTRGRRLLAALADSRVASAPAAAGPRVVGASEVVLALSTDVSRRIGPLIDRQLAIIDRMEQAEEDPDKLAKLFELDQMATLMRRTQERLLILAGAPHPRHVEQPAPVEDVLGAAVSAVEQYTRVEVQHALGFAVLGDAVFDLVHLITELLTNATSFSPPDTKVVVRVTVAEAEGLSIEIVDAGDGLPEAELERVNSLLATPHEIDVTTSARLGFDVAALVAQRQGITVLLRGNDAGGLTAQVTVPSALLSTTAASEKQEPGVDGLLAEFVRKTGIRDVIVVSELRDLVARPRELSASRAELLSAVSSGMFGMSQNWARTLEAGSVTSTVVEMAEGLLVFVASAGDALRDLHAVALARHSGDVSSVAGELTLLLGQVEEDLGLQSDGAASS